MKPTIIDWIYGALRYIDAELDKEYLKIDRHNEAQLKKQKRTHRVQPLKMHSLSSSYLEGQSAILRELLNYIDSL